MRYEEYKKLIKEDINNLIDLKEQVIQEMQEIVIPSMDFPCDNYNLSKEDIDSINRLRHKEVAIYDLIEYLDKEIR